MQLECLGYLAAHPNCAVGQLSHLAQLLEAEQEELVLCWGPCHTCTAGQTNTVGLHLLGQEELLYSG